MSDMARLNQIRQRHAALDGAAWLFSDDGAAKMIEARGRDGSIVRIATFDGKSTVDEQMFAVAAPDDVGFLLGLIDRAIADANKRKRAAEPPQTKDYAAEIAMKCQEPAFKAFLIEKHRLEDKATDERVVSRVRSMLRVSSRREVNNDEAAQERWKALRSEFANWKRVGR
ncbi:hypothetical protein [Aliihoeflea sp. PC F10.4]